MGEHTVVIEDAATQPARDLGEARWRWLSTCLAGLGLLALGCRPDGMGPQDDPMDPPMTGDELVCAASCGDGVCDPSREDCGTCSLDCATAECGDDGVAFRPHHTAIALGHVLEDHCGTGVVTASAWGLAQGADAMPFEQSPSPLRIPAGCGGISDDEPTVAQGVSLRDGSLGTTLTCLSLLPNAKSAPLGVGLRYEVGRWRDSSDHPGDYERPGTLGLGGFWFASYSRRLHGEVPAWQPEPWAEDELPESLTLVREDYRSVRFVRDGSSRTYRQPGVDSETASVAFLELIEDAHPAACVSDADPFRFIANNDAVLHYADGTRDVFSGRDLTFKGHIADDLSHLVVTHGTVDAAGGPSCGSGSGVLGIKRIASYPAFSDEPLGWIDLEHEYVEQPWPGHAGQTMGQWQLQRIVDSEGRVIALEADPTGPGRPLGMTIYEGAPDERRLSFGYDDAGVLNSIAMPASDLDGDNEVTMVHDHPPAEGGASRVLSQSRSIGGTAQTTTLSWSDGDVDLEVGLPGGHFQRFAHERPQGSTQTPLHAEGRDHNRLTEIYGIDATSNPERIQYDEQTGQVAERCDPMSSGPVAGASIGDRCAGYVYDEDHDLVEVIEWADDGEESRTQLEYEVFAPGNDHRLAREVGPMGDEIHYRYETDSWLGGHVETVRLIEETDSLDNTTTTEWCEGSTTCPWGMAAAVISPVEARTDFVYDPVLGTPMLLRDGDLVQERTAYDARGCLTAKDGRNGIATQLVYAPEQGDCLPEQIIENPEGAQPRVTAFEYDDARNLVRTIRDAEGGHSNSVAISEADFRVIDAAGTQAAVRRREGLGGDTTSSEHVTTYSPLGDVVREEELEMGRSTEIEYERDSSGEVTVEYRRSGIGSASTERFNAAGQLLQTTDEIGVTTTYEYDEDSGRRRMQSTGTGDEEVSTHYEYALDGRLDRMVEPDDVVTEYTYDETRRLVAQERAGIRETLELDGAGRATSRHRELVTGETITVQTQYTEEGRGSRVQSTTVLPAGMGMDPVTVTHHYETEAMPWGSCQTSNPGNCYDYTQIDMPREHEGAPLFRLVRHDGLGRLVEATTVGTDSSSRTHFDYAYDGLDCLRQISGGGGTQSFECDRAGRRVSETAWDTRTWEYYPDGAMRTFVDFNGTTTHYDLDDSGWRIGRVHYSDEPDGIIHAEDVELSYLDNDLLASMIDGSGTTEYAYDSLGRVRTRTHTPDDDGLPLTLGYEYAPGSLRLSGMDYWGEDRVDYTYDDQGRVAIVDAFGLDQNYDYDDDGRIQSTVTGLSSQVMSTVYRYDPLRRVDGIEHKLGMPDGAGPSLLGLHYGQLDAHGNIGSILEQWGPAEPPISETFAYDENDRLTAWSHGFRDPEYWSDDEHDEFDDDAGTNAYDERGNALTFMGRAFEYDTDDRITTEGFAYDANGNLVCLDDSGECHCLNGIQDADETDVDCGGSDCACCLVGDGESPPPAFVGTSCPSIGGQVDFDALRAEAASYDDPGSLMFTMEIPYDTPGCSSIPLQLPVPCGESSYQDYRLWRMGGAIQPMIIPFTSPNWVHNPSYFAEGMMDPFYVHPAKSYIVDCNNGGAGGSMCAIGSYGDGLSDSGLEPCDMAREDTTQGPQQPGPAAYDGNIRAFPVYQRAEPDLSLPEDYQLCYDVVDLHAQGGAFPVCQSASAGYHGSVFVAFQGVGACL